MSVIHTESWMAFGPHNGDDSANTTLREAYRKAYIAAGYEYFQEVAGFGWVIRPHPVTPERQALVFSAATANNRQYVVRKRVGNNTAPIIGGFSLFVPSEFVPTGLNVAEAAYGFLGVTTGATTSILNKMVAAGTLYADEVFRVRYDLQIAYGSEVQSARRITPGKMAYLEYRITQTEIRVWLDDVLVLQKSVARNNSTINIATVAWAPGAGSGMSGIPGRWAIADWYNLVEDAVTPNVRLGPATRVIGVRAESDSFAQFMRPSGFASNAAVAALPLNPDSANYLKTDTIGVQDIYSGTEDSATATAAIVHAMSVKVIGQNIEAAVHTMSPLLVSNGVAQGAPIALPAAVGPVVSFSAVDPNTGVAWTGADAAVSQFGMKLES